MPIPVWAGRCFPDLKEMSGKRKSSKKTQTGRQKSERMRQREREPRDEKREGKVRMQARGRSTEGWQEG